MRCIFDGIALVVGQNKPRAVQTYTRSHKSVESLVFGDRSFQNIRAFTTGKLSVVFGSLGADEILTIDGTVMQPASLRPVPCGASSSSFSGEVES